MSTCFDLVVIGAGPGGYEAALEAAKLGMHTALIEKMAVGGTCLNRGCIPTKALMHSAELAAKIRGAAEFGIRAQEPEIDLKAVQEHKENTIAVLQKGIRSLLKGAKVTLYEGKGKVCSPNLVEMTTEEGEILELEAEKILLATGSVPSLIPIPGIDLPGVMTSDEVLNLKEKPESLLIIGGGVIGVEFAGIYQSFGSKVTIVEALPSLLANMDKELGQSVKMSLKKKGLDIHTGARVEKLEACEQGIRCTFTEKEETKACEASKVLVAVGRRPFTEGLFSEECTPSMERGKICVDANYETSIPGMYAIGDVNGILQLAHAATAQGIRAVHGMTGEKLPAEPMLIPSCVYTDPEVASAGLTLAAAQEQGLLVKTHKIVSSSNGKSVLSGQERGFMKVVYLEESHVIVGAQLYCARATDMISEFAAAIQQKMTLEEMAAVIRPHPSFSEMITDVAKI